MNKPESLVKIGSYPDSISAHMVKGVLSTNGVECVLSNDVMSSILPLPSISWGEVSVFVFQKDLELAKEILDSEITDNQEQE